MRIFSFLFWIIFTTGLIYFLDNPQGKIPALGKLLSPTEGFWQQLEGESLDLPKELVTDKLLKPVEVVWDEHLIPHLYAENESDLYYVQGYITAQMRLWQMDFQTRAAAGRISEVVGDAALEFDKSMRRKGMITGAEKNTQFVMNSDYAFAFEKYAEGVNDYISTLDERSMPLEYKLLGMKPEEWNPYKSMLLLEYMTNMLNSFNYDIEYTNFLEKYGMDAWHLLYGGLDNNTDPIVDNPGGWDFEAIQRSPMPTDIVLAPADLTDNEKPNPENGSNNWAVSPSRSATGNALLANDPHLRLNLPSLWMAVHLHAPDLNVMGASLPGTPAIIIGFNDNIAWGFTNAQRDLVDWYKVEFADEERTAILVDGKKEAISQEIQEIKIAGGGTIFDTLYHCSFGIIANYSQLKHDENTGWAYRWIGQDESQTALAFIKLNHGSSLADYMDATNHFYAPGQNIVFADIKGNIAIRVQGKFLVRAENEGLFLRDGTKSENKWNQFIPFEQNAIQINPERGFVSSANQQPVDSTYPYFIAATQYEVNRNRRINSVLVKDSSVSIEDMMALHMDNFNMEASEYLSTFLAALEYKALDNDEQKVFEMLMNWNYVSDADLEAPAYYDAWRNAILDLAWDEMSDSEVQMITPRHARTFKLLKEQPNLNWWDIQNTEYTEDGPALIRYAFNEAMTEINQWKKEQNRAKGIFNWGNFKGTEVTHLTRQKALSQPAFTGGNKGIVNATSSTHGPSWRQIVDLDSNGVKAFGIYPGGQSGNPGSMYYTNFIGSWAQGEYLTLDVASTPESLSENAIQTTTFKTAK